jgi:hypothetical protein
MKKYIAISILLVLKCSYSFSQGQFLVTKTLISQYDSTIKMWTQPEAVALGGYYDGVVKFYLDSIAYVVSESEYRFLQNTRQRKGKKSTRNSTRATEIKKGWSHSRKSYSMNVNLHSIVEPDIDSCYTKYKGIIIENGTRRGSHYFAIIKNNKSNAEVKLVSCSSIEQFRKAIIQNGLLDIIINQPPQRNEPFSKWRLQLEICRVPQYEYD